MGEDKIIDQIIAILVLMNSYVPTTAEPANPSLPVILQKLATLQAARTASKAKFNLNFLNIAEITKQITSINIK
jgi:hypothetical protein